MEARIDIQGKTITVDLSDPLDISIPLRDTDENPLAWYLEAPEIDPVQFDDWIGKVSEGASVNFNNIRFNPHAHGTHTECLGHISRDFHSVNEHLKSFFFLAEVITVDPVGYGEDHIITREQIANALGDNRPQALIIRTLPNSEEKQQRKYSNTNWPYLEEAAAVFIREAAIDHLLIDLPSVDKEKDDGALLAHKAFWKYPEAPRLGATITEFIYVPEAIEDGSYLLNLMIAPFHNDATPSKPVLYKLK